MFLYFGICESRFSHEKGSYNKERVYNDLLLFLIGIDLSFLFDSVMKLRLTWIFLLQLQLAFMDQQTEINYLKEKLKDREAQIWHLEKENSLLKNKLQVKLCLTLCPKLKSSTSIFSLKYQY